MKCVENLALSYTFPTCTKSKFLSSDGECGMECLSFESSSFFVPFQVAKEKELLELCYHGTVDIDQFSSLLKQGVDPDIYDEVCY